MQHNYSRHDSRIVANADEEFVIELPANPTTGCEWDVEQADEETHVTLDVAPTASGALGAGSTARITVHCDTPGVHVLTLRYGQPWESEPEDSVRFEVEIRST